MKNRAIAAAPHRENPQQIKVKFNWKSRASTPSNPVTKIETTKPPSKTRDDSFLSSLKSRKVKMPGTKKSSPPKIKRGMAALSNQVCHGNSERKSQIATKTTKTSLFFDMSFP